MRDYLPSRIQTLATTEEQVTSSYSSTSDLDSKIAQWRAQAEALYGVQEGASSVAVTVLAAVGVQADANWIACCSGVVDETGTASQHYSNGEVPHAPRGSPSWAHQPMTLHVHDITADLLLLICEGGRHAVGRAVVPLSDLLPLPFSDWLTRCGGALPATHELWCQILPPGPMYSAQGEVHATLAHADPSVSRSGLAPPVTGELARALIRIEILPQVSFFSAFFFTPAFDATAATGIDAVTGRAVFPPERIGLAAARASRVLSSATAPAVLLLVSSRPWSIGGALILLAGCTPPRQPLNCPRLPHCVSTRIPCGVLFRSRVDGRRQPLNCPHLPH